MTELESAILGTLLELDTQVRNMAATNPKPNLVPLFRKIDELSAQLPETTHPRLQHYLYKRSYEKALLFLQGRGAEIQRGQCDGSQPARS